MLVWSLVALGPELIVQAYSLCKISLIAGENSGGARDQVLEPAHAVASAIGFCVLAFIACRLARPVRRISYAANALAAGDYRRRVCINTGDELENLASAFNTLGDNILKQEEETKKQAALMAGMVEAASIVSSTLDAKHCGKIIAKVVCSHLGAAGATVFSITDGSDTLKTIGRSGSGLIAPWRRLANHTADSGEYLVVGEPRLLDTLEQTTLVGIPLVTGQGTIGAIVAGFEGDQTPEKLRLGEVIADVLTAFGMHAAAAIQNSEAYSQTEKYSAVLEDWVEHLSAVMQVTNAISPSLTLDETLRELACATASVLNSDECAIFMLDKRGNLSVTSCCDLTSPIFGLKLKPGQAISGVAFSERRPVSCYDVESDGSFLKSLNSSSGFQGVLSAPLLVEDRAIGAITVYSKQPRHFTNTETRLLTSIALHAAVIVRNAGLYTRESSIAESLQNGLISQTPETCAGMQFASRYLPALDEARVGGDFYDVMEFADGRVAVVMGDVSGKGLQAAIHLAACKYMLMALAHTYPDDPELVIYRLNESINQHFNISFFVTMFYGIIDPSLCTLTYVNAGHPPAILISEDGLIHDVLASSGTPAGSGCPCEYEAVKVNISPSDMLLLYTDGVTDAVVDGNLLGVEGLHSILFEAGKVPPSELVDLICNRIQNIDVTSARDDIALMAISFDEIQVRGGLTSQAGGKYEFKQFAINLA